MAKRAYRLQAVMVNTKSGVDFNLTQVASWGHTPNLDTVLAGGAGALTRTFGYVRRGEPLLRIVTPQLATLFAEAGPKLKGLVIDADADDEGIVLYLQRMDSLGAMAGATHFTMTVAKGLMVLSQVRAQDGQGPAVAVLDVHAADDGTNAAVAIAGSVALGVATPTATEAFEIGPAQINNTTLEGIDSLVIDGGNRVEKLWGDGDVFPQEVYHTDHNPTISAGSAYVDILATLGITGAAIDANDAVFYLRKCADDGTRVAAATGQHISFTVDKGIALPMPSDFAADPPILNCDVQVQPVDDQSNDTIALSTTAVYTI